MDQASPWRRQGLTLTGWDVLEELGCLGAVDSFQLQGPDRVIAPLYCPTVLPEEVYTSKFQERRKTRRSATDRRRVSSWFMGRTEQGGEGTSWTEERP